MRECAQVRSAMADLLWDDATAERRAELLAHIEQCAGCRQEYQASRQALRALDAAAEAMQPAESYWPGYEVRLRSRLRAPAPAVRFPWKWAWSALAATVLVIAFLAMRPAPQVPVESAGRADHIERLRLLCTTLANSRSAVDLQSERKQARVILADNTVLRFEAEIRGDLEAAHALERMEPLLLDLVHLPEKQTAEEWQAMRERFSRQRRLLESGVRGM